MITDDVEFSQEDLYRKEAIFFIFLRIMNFFLARSDEKVCCICFQIRRGGRVADCAGLLNRCRDLNPYREFESHPLRDLKKNRKTKVLRFFYFWRGEMRTLEFEHKSFTE